MVEGCTIVGGMQGITTHSSMTDIMDNRVSRTTGQAISVAEMSIILVVVPSGATRRKSPVFALLV